MFYKHHSSLYLHVHINHEPIFHIYLSEQESVHSLCLCGFLYRFLCTLVKKF